MIERFEQLLKGRIGLDAESVGRVVIERAVRQRMAALACADEDGYWLRVSGSSSEQQALVEAVVVPETWFFRYPESFAALNKLAFEHLPLLEGGRPLRILSLPCSSGEEPYSIVMALLDGGLAPQLFQVDAVDVSEKIIERARTGLYGRNSFRGEALSFRERYFLPSEEGYALADQVKRKVRFIHGNLLDPLLLSGEAPYDILFCRNLLIYFDRPTQAQVLQVLKRLLREDGHMFIGPAEASLLSQNGMQALGIPLAFVFRRASEVAPPRVAAVRSTPPAAATPAARGELRAPARTAIARPVRALAPAAVAKADGGAELLEIAQLANSGRSADAKAACERYLAQHGPSAAIFYWLGLLSDVAGQANDAQDFYRKALYLEPQHAEALAHLAALLAARGDLAGAKRLQERASRGEQA
ncbi:protein-glutamate O-methyltransferase CheR [Pseudomonas sp. PDM14]|uniref:CheR family methyltransferase n=1 Tax=Pseudomonas sp. PDM14 TaxID=2769288 RepID=UPI001780F862|nr:protein-glutamate O-methyltransferase CheR [Pseudomonas sp. PDM14]MBD9485072.1 protein-glutamate O-methyltransferase CheR [Pseudomonas sp. PDM14]